MDQIQQLAAAIVSIIAPFMPFLVEAGKSSSKKIAEVIAQKGGEAAWERAKTLWNKLTTRLGDDPVVKGAATAVADKPEDNACQKMLTEVLSVRLSEYPQLAQEILDSLGGPESVQRVLADHSSWVEDVTQQMSDTAGGEQVVQANKDSVIKGIRQVKR